MPNDKETGETPTEKNVNALLARLTVLESQVTTLTAERDEALVHLKQANDLIEADTKARLVQQALEHSRISMAELAGKDADELETIITVSKLAKKSHFESGATIGVGRDEKPFNRRTHLHTVYEEYRRNKR